MMYRPSCGGCEPATHSRLLPRAKEAKLQAAIQSYKQDTVAQTTAAKQVFGVESVDTSHEEIQKMDSFQTN
jgi:hypothetical protein